ncbi:RES domain-containing protein [Mucilaginibacter gracilis]|uniref:RES domain-containing protein n=1 Tax=Mucilaginibacter gracilis TaxID=423350 RepID=A0A495J9M7_9SPHI|nr:RES family NAD+ phosphorylase [Mucilaginibacter gracilis]RKR85188.1 RES domain-containing protein [Mucilaginibacter gracilis]
MILYRLTKQTYANDLSGAGAKAYGGRWNNKGKAMLYLTSSRSLAVLEVLVHLSPLIIPDNYVMVSIEAPDDYETVDLSTLPKNWKNSSVPILKEKGDRFLSENKNLLLKVPSSIVTEEFNYLANPLHTGAAKLTIISVEPFSFDDRLLP